MLYLSDNTNALLDCAPRMDAKLARTRTRILLYPLVAPLQHSQ